jgi:ribosomal protein S17E
MFFNMSYSNEKEVSHSKTTHKKIAGYVGRSKKFKKVVPIQSHIIILPLLIMNLMSNN